jgi:hypothetical protein
MNNWQWSDLCRFDVWRRSALIGIVLCAITSGAQNDAKPDVQNPADSGSPLYGSSQYGSPDTGSPGSSASLVEAVQSLTEQVRALQAMVGEMRADSAKSQAQTRELRHEVDQLRAERSAYAQECRSSAERITSAAFVDSFVDSNTTNVAGSNSDESSQSYYQQSQRSSTPGVEEQIELLSGKVDDQYQTKVESASKYRIRLSGIVLMNAFSNQGTTDNIDIPALAYPKQLGQSGGSVGATLRQSEIGFEVFGPRIAGARTKGDLQVDLAGGFAEQPNGVSSGLMRLRTATLRMDWDKTSIVAGQDGLFFSPAAPTSFATLAVPALSYAGNLWSWVPQIRVEHRIDFSDTSSFLMQGGILDPESGEVPSNGPYRQPGPGESARQPAYGARTAWSGELFGQPVQIGAGGFYSRQDYGYGRSVDAWAAMSDLQVPLGTRFSIEGKVYRGRALGGLYGGIGQSVLFGATNLQNPYTQVIGLNSVGGWAQLKYRAARKVEFNTAFGIDNPFARDLNHFGYPQTYAGSPFTRNRAGFVNVIYRPRSDLLLSAEYRQLETNTLYTGVNGAGHLNLAMGVLF